MAHTLDVSKESGSELTEDELEELFTWVDSVPLSRPKKSINRDFADGVMCAELIKHFLPQIVETYSYPSCNATHSKMRNWELLNLKVFKKLNFNLSERLIREIVTGKPNVVERFLMHLRQRIERALYDMKQDSEHRAVMAQQQQRSVANLTNKPRKGPVNDQPEADQNIDPLDFSSYNTENIPRKGQKKVTISPGRKHAGPNRGTSIHKVMDDKVPRAIYEEKEQECLAKEETIQILQAKVRRLEHLLHLKDIRIEDLQTRLETTRPTGLAAKR